MRSITFSIIFLVKCLLTVTAIAVPYSFLDETAINCNMYTTDCYHPIHISNSSSITDMRLTTTDDQIFKILSVQACEKHKHSVCMYPKNTANVYLIHIDALLIGKASVELSCVSSNCSTDSRNVIIKAPERLIDKFLQVYIVCFSMSVSLLMGIMLDLQVIKRIIKIPIPVLIGFCSQYIFMPLLSYCFIILFKLNPAEGLALFFYGCSPGGTVSNNWTIIFNGDLDLSVILTFFSTISSLCK